MNDDEIQAMWVYARGKWPSFTVSDNSTVQAMTLLAWRDEFGDLTVESVRAAMVQHGESQYLPALGLLRRSALDLLAGACGEQATPELDQAWSEVCAAIATHGRARRPEWSHPVVADTVRAVGWRDICDSDKLAVTRAQFGRMYETIAERHRRQVRPPAPALKQFSNVVRRLDDMLSIAEGGAA